APLFTALLAVLFILTGIVLAAPHIGLGNNEGLVLYRLCGIRQNLLLSFLLSGKMSLLSSLGRRGPGCFGSRSAAVFINSWLSASLDSRRLICVFLRWRARYRERVGRRLLSFSETKASISRILS